MQRVKIHIDRLVLRGFERSDSEAIAEGLRSQLTRLLANESSGYVEGLTSSRHVGCMRVKDVRLGADSEAGDIGAGLATGVAGGLRK